MFFYIIEFCFPCVSVIFTGFLSFGGSKTPAVGLCIRTGDALQFIFTGDDRNMLEKNHNLKRTD